MKTLDIIIEDITCIATWRCKISLRVLKNISPVSLANLWVIYFSLMYVEYKQILPGKRNFDRVAEMQSHKCCQRMHEILNADCKEKLLWDDVSRGVAPSSLLKSILMNKCKFIVSVFTDVHASFIAVIFYFWNSK